MKDNEQRSESVSKGAKYGVVVGLSIGQYVIASNSPLGFYPGSVLLVLCFWIALGAGVGAGLAWLVTNTNEPL